MKFHYDPSTSEFRPSAERTSRIYYPYPLHSCQTCASSMDDSPGRFYDTCCVIWIQWLRRLLTTQIGHPLSMGTWTAVAVSADLLTPTESGNPAGEVAAAPGSLGEVDTNTRQQRQPQSWRQQWRQGGGGGRSRHSGGANNVDGNN
jgi:hypothetical protein